MQTRQVTELTIRLPSALLGTLGVLLTYWVGVHWWGQGAGLTAAVVLASSFEWWRAATTARVDMTLTFFMVAAWFWFLWLYQEGKGGWGSVLLLALLLGLATLAKGPIGGLLPGLTIGAFLWLRRDWGFLRALHPVATALVVLLIAGSWYALALWQGGVRFFLTQIVHENLLAAAGQEGHEHPFYYFLPGLFLGMVPWSVFFPALGVSLYRSRRTLSDAKELYLLVWCGTVFVFFSLPVGKRTVYILPLYPAVALLWGAWWQQVISEAKPGLGWVRVGGYVCAALFFAAVGLLGAEVAGSDLVGLLRPFLYWRDQATLPLVVPRFVAEARLAVGIWLGVSGLGGLGLLWALRRAAWEYVFGCLAGLTMLTLLCVGRPVNLTIAGVRTYAPFIARVRQSVGDTDPLFFYRTYDDGALFYARRRIPELAALEAMVRPGFVLMRKGKWEKLSEEERRRFTLIDSSEGTGPEGNAPLVLVFAPLQSEHAAVPPPQSP